MNNKSATALILQWFTIRYEIKNWLNAFKICGIFLLSSGVIQKKFCAHFFFKKERKKKKNVSNEMEHNLTNDFIIK